MSLPEELFEKLPKNRILVILDLRGDFGEKYLNHIIKIEKSCYNNAIISANKNSVVKKWENRDFELLYYGFVWNVYNILNNYPNFLAKLENEEIDPKIIPLLEPYEVLPEKYDKNYKEKVYSVTETVKTTSIYFCPNCKKNKTTYKSIQNRAADEGLGVEATCSFCAKVFRV